MFRQSLKNYKKFYQISVFFRRDVIKEPEQKSRAFLSFIVNIGKLENNFERQIIRIIENN